MENFRLKAFRTVAQHLNFRRAAEELCLSQPAVTLPAKAVLALDTERSWPATGGMA